MDGVGVYHLVGVNIRLLKTVRIHRVLAAGRKPGAMLGLDGMGLLGVLEIGEGELAVSIQPVFSTTGICTYRWVAEPPSQIRRGQGRC